MLGPTKKNSARVEDKVGLAPGTCIPPALPRKRSLVADWPFGDKESKIDEIFKLLLFYIIIINIE